MNIITPAPLLHMSSIVFCLIVNVNQHISPPSVTQAEGKDGCLNWQLRRPFAGRGNRTGVFWVNVGLH